MDNEVRAVLRVDETGPSPAPGLWPKLAAVMANVTPLEKRGQVDGKKADGSQGPKYAYVRSSDVLEMIRPLLAGQKVLLLQVPEGIEKSSSWLKGWYQFTFIDADTGQTYTQRWYAEANDGQDKGPQKLATSARKNFLIAFFLLGSDDEDPTRPKKSRPDPTTGEVVQTLTPEEKRKRNLMRCMKLAEQAFPGPEAFDEWFSTQGFGCASPDNLDTAGLGMLHGYLQAELANRPTN